MADSRKPRRDGRPSGGQGGTGASAGRGTGSSGRGSSGRGGSGRGAAGSGRGRPQGGGRGGQGGGSRGSQGGGRRPDRRVEQAPRTAEQQIYDGPPIPDGVLAKDLDKYARQQLQNIPEKLADKVARHLVMAGSLLAEDPELAHKHALAARARAMRNALVREAVGETAYACGKWAEALAELRAAKRISGNSMYAPMMADCERALKRPEKAIAYDTAEIRSKLDEAGQIELSIVVAGARRDRGQVEEAVRLLETEPLHSKSRSPWVARLRYAYADALLAAGRTADAIEWFHRTIAVDGEAQTDAVERVAQLEG